MSRTRQLRTGKVVPQFEIHRADAYLGFLSIVITSAMESMNSTPPSNGYNLQPGSNALTNPFWIGAFTQFITVLSWYIVVTSHMVAIYNFFKALVLAEEANVVFPTILFIVGHVMFYMMMLMQDALYWFGMFREVGVNIPLDDGRIMFILSDIPLLVYLIFILSYSRQFIRIVQQRIK